MSNDKDIVITSAFRTPIGSFQGSLKDHKATELGTAVVKRCMEHSNLNGSEIDTVCNDINQGLDSESINMVGKTNLRQSMAIISRSSFCIGSDTGFIYASEALGINTVAILGPTSIETGAGVFSKNSINIEDNNLWCRPCSQNGSFPCYRTKQYCMSNITPKEVIENVEKILA